MSGSYLVGHALSDIPLFTGEDTELNVAPIPSPWNAEQNTQQSFP